MGHGSPRVTKKAKRVSHHSPQELHLLPLVLLRSMLEFLSDPCSVKHLALTSKHLCEVVRRALQLETHGLSYLCEEIEEGEWGGFVSGLRGEGCREEPLRVEWDMMGRHVSPYLDISLPLNVLFRQLDFELVGRAYARDANADFRPPHIGINFDLENSTGFLHTFSGGFFLFGDGTYSSPALESLVIGSASPTEWSVGYLILGDLREKIFARHEEGSLLIQKAQHGRDRYPDDLEIDVTSGNYTEILRGKQDFTPFKGDELVRAGFRAVGQDLRLILYSLLTS